MDVTELTDIAGVHRTKAVPPMITPAKDRANPSQALHHTADSGSTSLGPCTTCLKNYQLSRLA
jgi:hypothetical protein